jgi:leucyl-tRNA synthetase
LYSRFINKFLFDIGAVPFSEPYAKRLHHGVILGPDGRKMSKSWGNVVNPDEVVGKYGADVVRLYMMFIGPYESVTPWSDKAIAGVSRFVLRLQEMLQVKCAMVKGQAFEAGNGDEKAINKLVRKIANDVEKLKFNTIVSSFMEFYNAENKSVWSSSQLKKFLQILAPFAPYLSEEFWAKAGFEGSVHEQAWPAVEIDDSVEVIEIPVMINGRVRARLKVTKNDHQDKVVSIAMDITEVKGSLPNGHKKIVYVPGKALNFVA